MRPVEEPPDAERWPDLPAVMFCAAEFIVRKLLGNLK
jgi:hypothetical protein